MEECEVFKKIPFSLSYNWLKEDFRKHTDAIISNEKGRTPVIGVNASLAMFYDDMIDENGMDRVAVIVIAFIYEMERNDIDPDLAYAVNWHIEDFEAGDHDDLFTTDDLKLLKADIKRIKDYLAKHPELIADPGE